MQKNILIVAGHPDLSRSLANRTILDEVAAQLPQAEIRKLSELYPDYRIDVAAEQAALQNADVIVWQFPFSWYALPGLMKVWLDEVFLHGFAHGSTAKLVGKKLILSFTTGAPEAAYKRDGFMQHSIEDYLAAFESTAILCGLELQPAVYTCGIGYTTRDNETAIAAQREAAKKHAQRLLAAIEAV